MTAQNMVFKFITTPEVNCPVITLSFSRIPLSRCMVLVYASVLFFNNTL